MEKNLLTIESLKESKLYVRNGVTFQHPMHYIEPFLDAVGYDDGNQNLVLEYQNRVMNLNEEDNTENIAYPRLKIEVNKGRVEFGEYENVFGMLLAMDQQNPVVKVYSGMNVSSCTNLCVFGNAHVSEQNLLSSSDNAIDMAGMYYRANEEKIEQYREVHQKLITTVFLEDQLNRKLGEMLRGTLKSKLGTSPIIAATRYITDKNSVYSVEEDGSISAYKLYNAVTQSITDSKDILYKCDKSLAAYKLVLN